LLVLAWLATFPVACSQESTTQTTGISETTETTDLLTPPSPEELAQNNFVLPEIPRILCEKLKQMMDLGDNFTLVDTRINANFKLGYIPSAMNIPEDDSSSPYTQEWVSEQLDLLPKGEMIVFYCD
jgi:hypothetical protein